MSAHSHDLPHETTHKSENHDHACAVKHDTDAILHHTAASLVAKERSTRIVVLLSAATMLGELFVGWWTNSLALVADGWHMATHVGALGIAWLAYWYCRRSLKSSRLKFSQPKVLALAGYTNALGLGLVGVAMLWEAWHRFSSPEAILFSQAIPVAVLGLVVNLASARILHKHENQDKHAGHGHHHDHNLRAAYVHIIADAVTSVLAVAALVAGKVWGVLFLDPICAALGAIVVIVWATGLLRHAVAQLVDAHAAGSATETTNAPTL